MNFSKKSLKLASVLAGTMLLGGVLAGCGDDTNSNEIKVGANFEITGNQANYGSAGLDGLKLAIKEANDAGGIDGFGVFADGADDDSAAKDVAAEQGRGELQGVIEGDAMSFLLPVQQKLHAGESVVIDCSQLVRMDFGAAGSVLNWSAEMQGAGHAVRFVKLQQLVAVFFNIVGVGEHSLIVPRKD